MSAYVSRARVAIIGNNRRDDIVRSDAIIRMSVAAEMLENIAGELRDAVRIALDNKEGNQHCDDYEYELEVDVDISCIFEPVGA